MLQRAMDMSYSLETSIGCSEKLCHCQGRNHRSRWCRGTVEFLSLEAGKTPLDTDLKNLASADMLHVEGEAVPPLEDPSYLCASVIPGYSNKYFSSPWSKSKVFLHP